MACLKVEGMEGRRGQILFEFYNIVSALSAFRDAILRLFTLQTSHSSDFRLQTSDFLLVIREKIFPQRMHAACTMQDRYARCHMATNQGKITHILVYTRI